MPTGLPAAPARRADPQSRHAGARRDGIRPSWREIAHGKPQRAPAWWLGRREQLLSLAQPGTPHYVYDLATVRERARSLSASNAVDRCFYAIKANPHPGHPQDHRR
jgi:hypothetical protein